MALPEVGRRTPPRAQTAGPAVVEAGRRGLRGWGLLTADARPWPDFLVLGAKRGGTTSFYFTLLDHPNVVPLFPAPGLLPKAAPTKGVHFFDVEATRHGPRWYRSHFPSRAKRAAVAPGQPTVAGEASPYYLGHPAAAARAAAVVPETRLLVLLRDPVERTWSHYRESCKRGFEDLSFEDALAAEEERTATAEQRLADDPSAVSAAHEHLGYVRQSTYGPLLRRWLDRWPASRVLLLLSEDHYRDPGGVRDQVARFLGIPPVPLQREVRRNAAPASPMAAATRLRLQEHFASTVADVETLLGRPTPWQRP